MNKTSTSLAAASLVVAFALALVAPVSAQTYGGPVPAYGAPGAPGVSSTDTQVQSGTVTPGAPGAPIPPGASVAPGTASPGLPNTGAGGNAAVNYAILLSAGLIAVGGTVYLARKFAI